MPSTELGLEDIMGVDTDRLVGDLDFDGDFIEMAAAVELCVPNGRLASNRFQPMMIAISANRAWSPRPRTVRDTPDPFEAATGLLEFDPEASAEG